MSGQKHFLEFRQKHPVFEYKAYHYTYEEGQLKVSFDFEIPGLANFHPSWSFPVPESMAQKLGFISKVDGEGEDSTIKDERMVRKADAAGNGGLLKQEKDGFSPEREAVDALIFQLGMVELVSYWKTACPPTVRISAGSLSAVQAGWWKKLYFHGLGEFFFVNGIETDEVSFMELCVDGMERPPVKLCEEACRGCLVPIGGGKDSVVSLKVLSEFMKKGRGAEGKPEEDVSITTFSVNRIEAVSKVIDLCDEKTGDVLVRRTLDKEMLRLNKEGYLNGHTPFSAIVAFSSFLTAVLHGKRYITLSNENSANESTVRGSTVNHQYSKSYEFEQDFENYIRTVISSPIHYFSLLRPLSEIQIAKIFSSCTRYHGVFRSCNAGSKKGIWCGECPKCLFVYIILSPFLKEERLVEIFGENLLKKESLEKYFRELAGIDENKPFECVGTRSEVLASLAAVLEDREKDGKPLPLLLKRHAEYVRKNAPGLSSLLTGWCGEHSVPEMFLGTIREELREA